VWGSVVADAVQYEPVSSLQFGEMQGYFAKMQGVAWRNPPKSHRIPKAWMDSPYFRSSEAMLPQQRRESTVGRWSARENP